jgi:nucleotide-binding universal stress UspA family protein
MRTGDRPNFTPSSAAGFLATVMTSTKPSSGPIASSPSTTDQGIHVLIQSARGHSPPARAALAFGFAFAATHRRPLAAVHVTLHDGNDFWVDDQMLETHLTAEPAALAMLATEVEPRAHGHPQVAVKRAVYADRPVAGLIRAAAGAGLLVVGDRGRGPIARALLGSVADGLVNHATCTVAVTHTQDAPFAMPDHPHLAGERI